MCRMSRVSRPTPYAWRLIVAMAALASVLLVGLAPPSAIALDLPALHAALDSASVVIAIVVTFLFCGRYLRTGRLDDLVSTAVAVANLNGVVLSAWAPVAGQVAGALCVCAAALCPPRVVRRARMQMVRLAAASAAGFALLLAALSVLLPHLPAIVSSGASGGNSAPALSGPAGLLSSQALVAVCMAVAALGFSRRAEREGDRLAHWLALSCIVGALARIDYLLYPSLYTQWVSLGDVLRVARFAILLYAGCQEISGYWQSQSAAAVLEERRRLARDLHDGVAQELAFILRRARRGGDDPALAQIAAAADRALLDSRRAIAALSLPIDERFDIVLGRIAEETAGRAGAHVELHLDAADVDREHAEALIRIVSEAVQNATRHGGADQVRVELTCGPALQLRISDNGAGFDLAATSARGAPGFGLVSMRERAEAIGGAFAISSAPGEGTVVEVTLP
jgi:signal transduction histidine kinase